MKLNPEEEKIMPTKVFLNLVNIIGFRSKLEIVLSIHISSTNLKILTKNWKMKHQKLQNIFRWSKLFQGWKLYMNAVKNKNTILLCVYRLVLSSGSPAQLEQEPKPSVVWNLVISDYKLNIILHWTIRLFDWSRDQDYDRIELKTSIALPFYTTFFVSNH